MATCSTWIASSAGFRRARCARFATASGSLPRLSGECRPSAPAPSRPPTSCAVESSDSRRCWQQNRYWVRHRLRRCREAAACPCVSVQRPLIGFAEISPSFQYPSRDLFERTRPWVGGGPLSSSSPLSSDVGNSTSSGSAPGTGATKASMPCGTRTTNEECRADGSCQCTYEKCCGCAARARATIAPL